MKWFRMYASALNDPKVQRLPAADFKGWVNLLCLAAEQDGELPCTADIGFALRLDEACAEHLVTTMLGAGLIEADGCGYHPHNWDGRQCQSDSSTERVRRYRAKQAETPCNVTETLPQRDCNALEERRGEENRLEEIRGEERAPTVPNARKKRAPFAPPTLEQVEVWFTEHERPDQAQPFYLHYEKVGWTCGRSSMKSWSAAAGEWLVRQRQYDAERIAAKRNGNRYDAPTGTLQDAAARNLAKIKELGL